MTDKSGNRTPPDVADREAAMAEERFLATVQMEMQRLLNERGLRHAHLSRRLGVSEARVSQMFGDDATNLTLRTLAKVFHNLGEAPLIMARSELERQLAAARGAADPSPVWVLAGSMGDLNTGPGTEHTERVSVAREHSRRVSDSDWLSAERSAEARRADAA